ncbi:MAG TPA: hypothetical protein VGD01_03370 [Candidatus Elarobacter sp.]|jgi:hypothetical protein
MERRSIAEYSTHEFDMLRSRLERARDLLRAGGALLQSVARAYYVLYALASFLSGKYGIHAVRMRSRDKVMDQRFSHMELPALVYALYSANKKDSVQDVGSAPGIVSGAYDEHEAYRKANDLVRMRIQADYGPSTSAEPYSMAQTDAALATAQKIVQDLETLL